MKRCRTGEKRLKPREDFYTKKVVVRNELGLHARCASRFVETANNFSSKIKVISPYGKSDGKSIMGILTLLAKKGTVIKISAKGKDAKSAVKTLSELVRKNFVE